MKTVGRNALAAASLLCTFYACTVGEPAQVDACPVLQFRIGPSCNVERYIREGTTWTETVIVGRNGSARAFTLVDAYFEGELVGHAIAGPEGAFIVSVALPDSDLSDRKVELVAESFRFEAALSMESAGYLESVASDPNRPSVFESDGEIHMHVAYDATTDSPVAEALTFNVDRGLVTALPSVPDPVRGVRILGNAGQFASILVRHESGEIGGCYWRGDGGIPQCEPEPVGVAEPLFQASEPFPGPD